MNRASSIVLAIGTALLFVAWKPYAERPTSDGEVENTGFQFIANNGQWNNNIRYMTDVPNGWLYLGKAGFSYVFQHPEDLANLGGHGKVVPQSGVMRFHIFKIDFVGASGNLTQGARPFREYHNYYHGNNRSAWASRVPLYREVQYPEMYNNIDLNIYGDDYQLKYDFLIKPGGDVQEIKMKYTGVDQLLLKDGKLHVVTSVNEIIEQEPYAFQRIDGQIVKVQCEFVVDGDIVTFQLPHGYDPAHQLTIDPKLIFSTFSGSLADNWGLTATFDFDGYVYSGGIVFTPGWQNTIGDTSFLPTVGAYQDSFAGGGIPYECDMGIIKYTPTGAGRVYSTYLGGSLNECPHSLVATPSGDLFILGTTGSSNFPTTIFAFDSTFNGGSSITSSSSISYGSGSDIVVSKLSADGTALYASSYIGGTSNDGLNLHPSTRYNYGDDFRGEIIVDGNGDCYIASTTASSNFPMVNGFQSTYGGGLTDGVSFKLNSNLSSLLWSSYLGGSNGDAAYAIQFDQANDVYVCGGTLSADFPTTSGALNQSSLGGVDGFVSHISSNGSNLVGSTYIGTSSYDQTYFVQLDSSENVYVVGQTEGTYPVIPDSIITTIYSNTGGNQFIHKLNNDLSGTAFSTVYGNGGGFPDISPSAFLVNKCGNIFVSGWGGSQGFIGSTSGLPTTPNAEQLTTDGSDFHLLVLFRDAVSLLYGSFFGGPISNEHVDGGTSRFDKNGIVYQSVCGGCGANSDFPTSPGAWSNTNNSPNCNNAVFVLDMSDLDAKFNVIPKNEGCVPFNATFQNISTGGLTYYWDYGDGTTSNLFDDSHLYVDTGVYNVLLVITDSITCQVQDSAFATVTVHPLPTPVTSPDTSICPGGTATLTASGGTNYIWSPASTLSCQTCPSPNASPDANTQYTVNIIDDNGCQIIDTVNVSILPAPIAIVGLDTIICPGNSVQLSAFGGVAYSWFPDSTLDIPSIPNPIASPTVTTDYVVTVFDLNGCSDDDTLTVTVQEPIVADAGQATGICLGDSVPLLASGGVTYTWSPTVGLSNPNIADPVASPFVSTWYYVSISNDTCSATDSVEVLVSPPPTADAGNDVFICEGDITTLTGYGGSTIVWNSVDTTASIVVSPDSTSTYIVLVQDIIGCADTDIVTVTVTAPPIIIASPDTTICAGEQALLMAAGGDTYLWSTGMPGSTLMVTPTDTTEYYVTGYDTADCPNMDTVVVNVIPQPIADPGIVADEGCAPFTVEFMNNSTPDDSSLTYLWNFGDSISGILNTDSLQHPFHTYDSAGTYLVTMTLDHPTCSGLSSMSTSTTVTVNAVPNAAIEVIPEQVSIFNPTVFITDNSTGGTSCLLIFPNGDTLAQCSGEYEITGTGLVTIMQIVHDGTCTDTAYADVDVRPGYIFFAPNTFSPNEDGFNDYFFGQGIGIKNYHMFIYDRWGDKLFESRDKDIKWDGKANKGGHIVQQDVYVYVFKITDFIDSTHTYIGHVTVIR